MHPPLKFFYTHFHNSIKSELQALSSWVCELDRPNQLEAKHCLEDGVAAKLLELRGRYRFLEQVYKYHSSVEDEVVYPALDAKVQNVTVAYRVEHQDEELLLEQCAQLISSALAQQGQERTDTIRGLICKVEEIHCTLKKHLQKEEEQLLPLLLAHFNYAEQAALVAQFLYCIPLAMVDRVLEWLKPQVPQVEQIHLLHNICAVVPDELLLQLLTNWLAPTAGGSYTADVVPGTQETPAPTVCVAAGTSSAQCSSHAGLSGNTTASTIVLHPPEAVHAATPAVSAATVQLVQPTSPTFLDSTQRAAATPDIESSIAVQGCQVQGLAAQHAARSVAGDECAEVSTGRRPPILEIIHIHRTICSALEEFAAEASNLQQRRDVSAIQLGSLLERHRFLRSVCMFHTISEEEVMYPAVRQLMLNEPSLNQPGGAGESASAACMACEREHETEVTALDDLGRLLADVRAFARRGRKEVSQMLQRLSTTAQDIMSSIAKHMAREETEVFPLLERHLGISQQRKMVWQTISAMPLRLLERVLPWVTATLNEQDSQELVKNIRLGAPDPQSPLVALMVRWAERGRAMATAPGPVTKNVVAPSILSLLPSMGGADSMLAHPHQAALQTLSEIPAKRRRMGSVEASQSLEGISGAVYTTHSGLMGGSPQASLAGSHAAVSPGLTPTQALGVAGGDNSCCVGMEEVSTSSDVRTTSTHHNNKTRDLGPGTAGDASVHSGFIFGQRAAPAAASAHAHAGNTRPPSMSPGLDSPRVKVSGSAGRVPSHTPVASPTKQQYGMHAAQHASGSVSPLPHVGRGTPPLSVAHKPANRFNPIDHIFQFHQAFRQELRQLEADALTVEKAVFALMGDAATTTVDKSADSQEAHREGSPSFSAAAENGVSDATHSGVHQQHQQHQQQYAAVTHHAIMQHMQQHGINTLVLAQGMPGTGGGAGGNTSPYLSNKLPKRVAAAVQSLDGHFQFLWGIYRAHSRSEDEIVFPALESKQALRNVSHAYTLDHQQEEQMFLDLAQMIEAMRNCEGELRQASEAALSIRRMCAALRASLETHIRAEEAELWPLFPEHFTHEEQQYLVGVIIGRTGAQVLQTLLPWISESFTIEEKELMMGSLRAATKNTMFDQWLEAVSQQPACVVAGTPVPSDTASPDHAPTHTHAHAHDDFHRGSTVGSVGVQALPDPELARFLPPAIKPAGDAGSASDHGNNGTHAQACAQHAQHGQVPQGATAHMEPNVHPAGDHETQHEHCDHQTALQQPPTAHVESSTFRPGWEDIFRMNQKQLEEAIMRVSADPHLEPGRKAYLIQNIMVSKYIVAQQKRMKQEQEGSDAQDEADLLDCVAQQHGVAAAVGGHCHHLPGAANAAAAAAGTCPGQQLHGCNAGVAGNALAVHPQHGHGLPVGHAPAHRTWRKSYHDYAKGILGCKHYSRKASLVAPCCQKIFPCRLCHDEAMAHRMDRYAVTHMQCMECGTSQPVGGHCVTCGVQLARYYCNICHLFDDEPGRPIYHCPFCNVCRRGHGLGIDFFHCMACNACMSLSLFRSHTCREKAMESNCPVCSEYLFDSADPIKELPCGHLLHSRCFAEYTRYNYTCPLCSKSVGDMSVYFQMLDSLLASERLPPEYAGRMQQVLCNDCGKTGFARFHFAYHACPHCRSYNTRVL